MRKDVKIGLGIGGVLLAVLIVYALVPKNDTQYARDGDTTKPSEDSIAPAPTGGSTNGGPASSGDVTPPGTAPRDNAATPTGNATPGEHVATRDKALDQSPAEDAPQATTPKIDWDKILLTGLVPDDAKVPLAARPNPVDDVFGDGKPNGAEPNWNANPQGHNTQNATGTLSAQGSQQKAQPKPQAADAKPQTASKGITEHTVQQGENLSMIAAVAYGDARKYKEILKANPGLDERKLRPGTILKMPDASTFAAATPTAAQPAKAAAKIDPKTQYEVEKDDNLSRISAKLYGSTAKAKTLYDLNKDKIGDDPGKLKLGTVLKLPEPPTVQQAAR